MALGPVGPIPAGPNHVGRMTRGRAYALHLIVTARWTGNSPFGELELNELDPLNDLRDLARRRQRVHTRTLARMTDGGTPPAHIGST